MKRKLVISALVLGFSIAPSVAFADSLTTIQGGTPIYSCNSGDEKVENLCQHTNPESTNTYSANITTQLVDCPPNVGGYAQAVAYVQSRYGVPLNEISIYKHFYASENWTACRMDIPGRPGANNYQYVSAQTDVYSCNPGDDLLGTDCVTTIPASISTYEPTVSGSNGGSLVASITGFLSPIWNFITDRLLPAISLLVVLGIGVRLSIKAVRKFSKVA